MRVVVGVMCGLTCLTAGWAHAASPEPAAEGRGAPSNPSPGADATLSRLLEEVRQLRVALQRATVANTRFQMAIERMRIQQTHVDAIQRQLDGVRSELANLEDTKAATTERMKDSEERSKLETGEDHDALEQEARRIKQAVAALEREIQSHRNQEGELTARLAQEEGRLDELDRQLDSLMQELKELSPNR